MRASGNGSTDVCASNLLLTFRGEVPYERVKGLDPRLMDKPVTTAEPEIRQDAEWLLETYEPRAEVQRVTLEPIDTGGGYTVTVEIEENEQEVSRIG
jgi:phage baseplate assembly protein W|nr:MAG TPA: lysozyme [Caudoviricetes sp.]